MEFALDQKRELYENARMDVGATHEHCPRLSVLRFLAIRLALSAARRYQTKTSVSASGAAGAFLLDSSSQYLHVFILSQRAASDDSDDFDKPAVTRQSGKIVPDRCN